MIGRALGACAVSASAALLVYLFTLALTPDPQAPPVPSTWPSPPYTSVYTSRQEAP